MSEPVDITKLPGLLACVVLTGHVESSFAQCREDLRSWNIENGLTKVEYKQFDAKLVEAGRDAVVSHMLASKTNGTPYQWVLMIDADATFDANALHHILNTAYNLVPDSDVVGAYAQLHGSYLPTIDTGSGTWEVHYPGEGVLPVIRTGGHFLLCKRSAFEKLGDGPWFRTRLAWRAIDALAEVDGFARQKLAGRNPFVDTPEWQTLVKSASGGPDGHSAGSVGEDSGFCDRLKARGGQIYVDTNLVTGHISRMLITPDKLKERADRQDRQIRLACGIME